MNESLAARLRSAAQRPAGATAVRWLRFNLVGLVGCAGQLALVSVLSWSTTWPVAVSVALAVLVTVSHNFVWHVRYTWSVPGLGAGDLAKRWALFNLSSGAVSLVCNVLLTGPLATMTGWPVTVANLAAVCVAALVNFVISDRIVFRHAAHVCSSCLDTRKEPRLIFFRHS